MQRYKKKSTPPNHSSDPPKQKSQFPTFCKQNANETLTKTIYILNWQVQINDSSSKRLETIYEFSFKFHHICQLNEIII